MANSRGETRSRNDAAMAAKKQAVPVALSQFHSNTAAYGAGCGVTGGTRVIMLCRPGTSRPFNSVPLFGIEAGRRLSVQRLSASFTGGAPHARTHTTRNRYGSHAVNTSPADRDRGAAV